MDFSFQLALPARPLRLALRLPAARAMTDRGAAGRRPERGRDALRATALPPEGSRARPAARSAVDRRRLSGGGGLRTLRRFRRARSLLPAAPLESPPTVAPPGSAPTLAPAAHPSRRRPCVCPARPRRAPRAAAAPS